MEYYLIWDTVYSLTPYIISLVALLLLYEQISYLKKKSGAPGPSLVLPFIGNVFPLVIYPTKFWEDRASLTISTGAGFCVDYIIGRFIVFIRSSDLSHKVFHNVRPQAFSLIGHPFGKKLFGEHNLIYLMGQDHKDLRRRIAPNFTPRALSTYSFLQQLAILNHFKSWLSLSKAMHPLEPMPLRPLCRDMNLETSEDVFVGPYLDEESRKVFKTDYNSFNIGLMKLPIDLPGFAFRNARLAAARLMQTLSVCAEDSKERMISGEEPTCLIDFWMQDTVREMEESGEQHPPHSDSKEIGAHLFDFLFAAQDASTSSLLWAVTLLDAHPEVVERVRKEVSGIWSPEDGTLITAEQLREMKYTEAVAREVVRIKAPATLVPHIATADFPLTNDYTIPKGAIVFPSVYESSFQGFVEPDRFDPDRFMEERQEDRVYKKNYLAFGAGPHQCIGQRYAINHLVIFIALFTSLIDFKRHRTDGCDEIKYCPTICPKDDCKVFMSQRCTRFPPLSPNKVNLI